MPDTKINPKGIGELMNIFNNLRNYAAKWTLTSSRNFTPEEIKAVSEAVVVSSSYGNSVCFHMVAGGITFIPLSTDSSKGVGEVIDLNQVQLLTLSKEGESDIVRVKA